VVVSRTSAVGRALSKALAKARIFERVTKGPSSSEVIAHGLGEVAGSPAVGKMTSAEYAWTGLQQLELPLDVEVGHAARFVDGVLDPKLSPAKRGELLTAAQVLGIKNSDIPFFQKEQIISEAERRLAARARQRTRAATREVERRQLPLDLEGVPPPKVPPPPREGGERILIPPDVPGGRGGVGDAFLALGEPSFALSGSALGRQIHRVWRRARFDAAHAESDFAERLSPLAEVLGEVPGKQQKELSRNLFRAINSPPESNVRAHAEAALTPKQRTAATVVREPRGDGAYAYAAASWEESSLRR
jgi:hypothetical protein